MDIYLPGHAGMKGNEVAHQLSAEGMCLNKLWARSRTSFSTDIACRDSEAQGEKGHLVVGGLGTCPILSGTGDTHPDIEHPELGSIWLSLGLVEMSEPHSESEQSSWRGGVAIESRLIHSRGVAEADWGEDLGTDCSLVLATRGNEKGQNHHTSREWSWPRTPPEAC